MHAAYNTRQTLNPVNTACWFPYEIPSPFKCCLCQRPGEGGKQWAVMIIFDWRPCCQWVQWDMLAAMSSPEPITHTRLERQINTPNGKNLAFHWEDTTVLCDQFRDCSTYLVLLLLAPLLQSFQWGHLFASENPWNHSFWFQMQLGHCRQNSCTAHCPPKSCHQGRLQHKPSQMTRASHLHLERRTSRHCRQQMAPVTWSSCCLWCSMGHLSSGSQSGPPEKKTNLCDISDAQ